MTREFSFPLPNGWFQIAYTDELKPGELKSMRYFGQELVLMRGEDGVARVFGAFCPHLGAHLGYGGSVEGNHVRCPFHGWEFGGDGKCARIPYAKRIPPNAKLEAWHVVEKSGLVLVHYHKEGKPPTFEVPDCEEYHSDEWSDYYRREFVIKSRNQELAENAVDPAHFKYVHRTAEVPASEGWADGHIFRGKIAYPIQMGEQMQRGDVTIEAHGLGIGFSRFRGIVDTTVVIGGTPIDDETVHQRMSFMVKKLDSQEATEGIANAFVTEISRQFSEDQVIWESKRFWDRPVLCDGDGPIAALRKWGQQFY